MSELRHDPLTDRWVIISPERGARPFDAFKNGAYEDKKVDSCPFCPGNEDKTPLPEIFAILNNGQLRHSVSDRSLIKPDWSIRVIPNKYPALQPEAKLKRKGMGVFDKISGVGAHEICIESQDHGAEIPLLPVNQIITVLGVLKLRMKDLEKDPRFGYLSLFKNRGLDAGASLEHPHWQLNALPITPSEVSRELRSSEDHFSEKERCLICDILSQEIESNERIVEVNEAFVVLSPFASRFAGELFIAPVPDDSHNHSFPDSDDFAISMLASILQRTLLRLLRKYNDPSYNIVLHTAPIFRPTSRDARFLNIKEDYHWHVHIFPRIAKIAGFELGNDCFVNTVPPEEIARLLREAAV